MVMVAVVGSHNDSEKYSDAETLGSWLAGRQVHLLTGGGPGVMEAACKGFAQVGQRHGRAIAILPVGQDGKLKAGYPNPWVEIPIYTHLHGQRNSNRTGGEAPEGDFSRNHINARSAHVMVAFTGGPGTLAEVHLTLMLEKPVLALLPNGQSIDGKDRTALMAHFGALATRLQTFSELRKLQSALLQFL